jgi:beta-galactosidase
MLRFDDGGTVNTGLWHEILTPLSAETLATYTGDYYAGRAAITLNRVGSGRVVYVGAFGGVDLYTHLLARLERDGLALETWPQTPAGVEAAIREDDHGRAVTILLNHRDEPATVTLPAPHRNLLDGTRAAEFTIRTRDVAVLVQDEK